MHNASLLWVLEYWYLCMGSLLWVLVVEIHFELYDGCAKSSWFRDGKRKNTFRGIEEGLRITSFSRSLSHTQMTWLFWLTVSFSCFIRIHFHFPVSFQIARWHLSSFSTFSHHHWIRQSYVFLILASWWLMFCVLPILASIHKYLIKRRKNNEEKEKMNFWLS